MIVYAVIAMEQRGRPWPRERVRERVVPAAKR